MHLCALGVMSNTPSWATFHENNSLENLQKGALIQVLLEKKFVPRSFLSFLPSNSVNSLLLKGFL